tara:strand:- start:1787 stop:3088 length:1302 start_codon:yes stop_codon:yes gene_type:complete
MNKFIIRGRILSFNRAPTSLNDGESYYYDEDGALIINNGLIEDIGNFTELKKKITKDDLTIDHRPNLILPGFIDPHLHFSQIQVIASYASNLIEWLEKYTFLEEQRFKDIDYAKKIAKSFFDQLINNGTTTAASFCTIHPESVESFFEESSRRNMLMIGGKIMMDRNAPVGLLDTAQKGYDESKSLINKWHGRGRQLYAISPRFAITSSNEQLEITKTLLKEHPECYLQTHLSENMEEIKLVKKLFPNCKDYTDIYDKYNLLGSKSLFGHCIHLSEREIELISQSRSIAIFCPTSNLFLGSGLYKLQNLTNKNSLRTALATDIGGGTSFSMLKTMDEAYKVLQLQNQRFTPLNSFYQSTLGNAKALSLEKKIGSLEVGTDADLIILSSKATSAMKTRMERVVNLSEELFVLQTMGDDRSVLQVYIKGVPSKKI